MIEPPFQATEKSRVFRYPPNNTGNGFLYQTTPFKEISAAVVRVDTGWYKLTHVGAV